jgi:membrane-associated phospholipid phosphatase
MRIPSFAVCILLVGLRALPASAEGDRPYKLVPASFDVLRDEREIWKDVFQIHRTDLTWIVPIAAANAAAIATDGAAYRDINTSRTIQKASHAVSSLGAPYPLFAAAGSMYLFGRYTGSRRIRETGILGTQALVHTAIITGVLESLTNRRLPNASGHSSFWSGGDAWPSGHATMFWALSTVVAQQYQDHPATRWGAYSLATAVSVSRFTGRQHFPSDALASSVIGYFVGRWVVHRHSSVRRDLPN